jgi:hypothetical protein
VVRSIPIPPEEIDDSLPDTVERHAFLYDIDFVLGGKITKCHRRELLYTTAEAEGMIGDDGRSKRERKPSSVVLENADQPSGKETKGTAKKKGTLKASAAFTGKGLKPSNKRKSIGTASKNNPSNKKAKVVPQEDEPLINKGFINKDLYERHLKDFERSISRLQKVDQFGFFLEGSENDDDSDDPSQVSSRAAMPITAENIPALQAPSLVQSSTSLSDSVTARPDPPQISSSTSPIKQELPPHADAQSEPPSPSDSHIIKEQFSIPPRSWRDIGERYAADYYVLDRLSVLEKERKRRLGSYIWSRRQKKKKEREGVIPKPELWEMSQIAPKSPAKLPPGRKRNLTRNGIRVHPRVLHPKGVHWDLFRADVESMCRAAIARDPQGVEGRAGTLGHAAKKTLELMDQIYERIAKKHMQELEFADARHEFTVLLQASPNQEAAMQGEWRTTPFPERKYERLDADVICAGLSALDQRSATYEKETSLSDSFVGLAYTYNDTGQSEGWMKSVLDETTRSSKANTNDDAALSKEEQVANAIASDDGVVRAQVRATMRSLLIGVQDKVMTDEGILQQPELRSANWEDGTDANIESSGGPESPQAPHLVEQSVWGIDCYTRRNILICIEKDLDSETAVEFVEKWLLPAINACPVHLAHDLTNAAMILEGLPLQSGGQQGPIENDAASPFESTEIDCRDTNEMWSHSLIGKALLSKITSYSPPWLKAAAYQLRRAVQSLGHDFFRVHPKGHGSIVLSPLLKANTLVTFYRGEVYPGWRWGEKMDAIERTQQHIGLRPNLPDFYNMALERPQKDPKGYGLMIVDASRKAGHGSMLSHSCDPTCEVRVAALNGQLCLAMTTLRDVELGEGKWRRALPYFNKRSFKISLVSLKELTFDYNAVTESLDEYQAAVCLCGYSKCRGSFLHFATADCYQQVLNRNSPIAVRFSNLVKSCTKKVMAEDDDRILSNHGFGTAAVGAVGFNRHEIFTSPSGNDKLDSLANVPVWLRTYVADVLRYIEYERRALPIALLCDHFKKKGEDKTKGPAAPKPKPKKREKGEPRDKPENNFQYFVRVKTPHFMEKLGVAVIDMKPMEVQRQLRTEASKEWNKLSKNQKEKWKQDAIEDWKKAILQAKEILTSKDTTPEQGVDEKETKKTDPDALNLSKISFEAADAEGVSAMEQRIQHLAQALSRVGRVLDRHRENVLCESNSSSQNLPLDIHAPLAIMSDYDVVTWMWKTEHGTVRSLLRSINKEKCASPALQRAILTVVEKYSCLDKFVDTSTESGLSSSVARAQLSSALLEMREVLHDGVHELAKASKRFDLEKSRFKAKQRREESKLVSKRNVQAILDEIVGNVLEKCGERSDCPASRIDASDNEKEPQTNQIEPKMSPWLEHYQDRWKLEAAADILLMHARTSTFFKLVPYSPLESTPIEVYARELGNIVPRLKIDSVQHTKTEDSTNIVLVNQKVQNPDFDADMLTKGTANGHARKRQKRTELTENHCDPDEVIAKVTVFYKGDYVFSQLLQWFNGGIGHRDDLPDMLGCVVLPSIEATLEHSEGGNTKKNGVTLYKSQIRPRLFEWLRDPRQRGSSFPDDLSKVFKGPQLVRREGEPEVLLLGSPVLDFLIMGDDRNLNDILSTLDADRLRDSCSEGPKKSVANRLESTVDEGAPAQAVAKWVQCENPACLKWRRLPFFVDLDALPEQFFCKDNIWNAHAQSCDAPEDVWDENDTNLQNDGVAKASDNQMIVHGDKPHIVSTPGLKQYEIGGK